MTDTAIEAEGLGRKYRIGSRPERYKTLRDVLSDTALGPLRSLRSRIQGKGRQATDEPIIWALRDVSFEVKRGEVAGIIGRNGAGKSTLLRILSRITEPTEGYVDIHGRVGSLLEVGTGFHPELSGRENIYLNGILLGMKKGEIARKFDEIVAFAEVEKFIDTPVKHYSSGMYLRLAFGVAAHLEPEILIVDEVLAVGDAAFQKKCLGKMKAVAGEGRTVLFVSHNMAAVSNLCDTALVLDSGNVVFRGTAGEAIRRYIQGEVSTAPEGVLLGVDRLGAGGVRLKRMRIASNGRETGTYTCGAPLEIGFYYEMSDAVGAADLSIQVRFLDDLGATLITLWNRMVLQDRIRYPRSGWLTFRLDSLPLRPGRYPLTVWVKSGRGIEDWIERSICLEVVEGDVFGTGRMPPLDTGPVLVPHRFHVEEALAP
jgi:lipopolysaccharide transport system ATP-binding protein